MKRIGNEMQETMGIMSLVGTGNILDLCMVPGGYSASALKYNPQASVSGATLPEEDGGHKLLVGAVSKGAPVRVWHGDLTSLVGDMGIDDGNIPEQHPDFGDFQNQEIWSGDKFDLVFCDGQVLRNHTSKMAESRRQCEARRLTCSQLLIALRHVKVGGSIVVLLHKIDRWDTLLTTRTFDQFVKLTLFKPLSAHQSRGSFYLVAQNIQPDHKDALQGIQDWTKSWKDATFSTSASEDSYFGDRGGDVALQKHVTEVMNDYGERLILLGETPWKIQKEGIEKSDWYKRAKAGKETSTSTTQDLTGLSSDVEGLVISGRAE